MVPWPGTSLLAVVLGVAFECFFGLQLFEDDLWDAGGRRPYGDVFRSVFMKDVSGDVFENDTAVYCIWGLSLLIVVQG